MVQKIAIANDHAGLALKQDLVTHFVSRVEWLDLGAYTPDSVDYAAYGFAMGDAITSGQVTRGVLICGSGVGISIAANRNPAVRAALCMNSTMARLARLHNDANVVCLGARLVGVALAIDIVETFLNTAFEGGRHTARVEQLSQKGH